MFRAQLKQLCPLQLAVTCLRLPLRVPLHGGLRCPSVFLADKLLFALRAGLARFGLEYHG